MEIRPVQFTLVVVANDHNPTLLNPNFLEGQGIVMNEWGWTVAGDPITTPPFARVAYDSGVAITVETNKLQVADQASVDPSKSKIVDIAQKYVDVLPHIPYSSVGVNFQVIVKLENPEMFMKRHFLKDGKWDSDTHPLQTVGIKLVYPLDDGRLVMNLDHAHIQEPEKEDAVLVNANFHRDCSQGKSNLEQVSGYLGMLRDDWNYFNMVLVDTFSKN